MKLATKAEISILVTALALVLVTSIAFAPPSGSCSPWPECKGGDGSGGFGKPVKECSDRIDNDGDGFADYPADAGCSNKNDNDETNCGDGVCEGGETSSSCPADCAPPGNATGGGENDCTGLPGDISGDGDNAWSDVYQCCTQCNQAGERMCLGDGLYDCGDHDDDGCFDWALLTTCENGCEIVSGGNDNCVAETACTDSDGGVNYLTQGTCTDYSGAKIDGCSSATGAEDWYCAGGSNGNCALVATNCEASFGAGYTCQNGACTPPANQSNSTG